MRKKLAVIATMFLMPLITLSACGGRIIPDRQIIWLEDGAAVTLTLYAFDAREESIFGIPNLGHSFAAFFNLTDDYIDVGRFRLGPGEEVTVGTYGHWAHFGIWYNLEAAYLYAGLYRGVGSVSRNITADDMSLINEYLAERDFWRFDYNCSTFALNIWNIAAGANAISLSGLITPTAVIRELRRFDTFKLDRRPETFAGVDSAWVWDANEYRLVEWMFG